MSAKAYTPFGMRTWCLPWVSMVICSSQALGMASHNMRVSGIDSGNAEKWDQFIATFEVEKSMDELDLINSFHSIEIVELILAQANTFILRITEKADLDSLSMANSYRESGVAMHADPNFIRITQK